MEGKDPLLILHKLNSDFHRSKKEQIDRFLRDQDELNKRFGDCSISEQSNTTVDPVENDDGDDSSDDVESQFNLRLDTFRVRPLSARIGSWSLDEDGNKSPNKPFATVKLSNNDSSAAAPAQPPVVDQKDYQKYARDRSSSRDRKTSSKPRTRPNGIKDRNKSKDRSVRTEKANEHKTEEHANENQPQKLLVRRRHRPRTAMGLQIANNDDGTTTVEATSPKKESNKSSVALGTGPSSSRRPLRASAPAAPTRQQPTGWETAEEMKRNTFLERQSVVRGGRESPAPNTVGASVAALHHRNRQQELLASGSVSNLTSTTTTDPTSTLRSSLSFGGGTPRTGAAGKDPNGWASLTGTPRHAARSQLGADSLLSGNTTRGNSSQHQQLGTSNSTSSNSQGSKGLSHRKVGQGGPSEGGAVRTKVSLIKLPRLEGTLPKTMLQSKEHGLVANTPTG